MSQYRHTVPNDDKQLVKRFSFKDFVVGQPNELAHAAARRVAESAEVAFNPLFLYGGVGLGKTHLMHAIAWHIRETQPERRVAYLSAEKFMSLFIQAVRHRDTIAFKDEFRSVDVLMIDDIHFIGGKEASQEEFFHTFNALVDQNHQVVVSADKSPSDLEGLEDRLKSRLGWVWSPTSTRPTTNCGCRSCRPRPRASRWKSRRRCSNSCPTRFPRTSASSKAR